MTIAVDLGRKATKQTNKKSHKFQAEPSDSVGRVFVRLVKEELLVRASLQVESLCCVLEQDTIVSA